MVVDQVNALGRKVHSTEDIKKHWHDLRQDTQVKVAFNIAVTRRQVREPQTLLKDTLQQSITKFGLMGKLWPC